MTRPFALSFVLVLCACPREGVDQVATIDLADMAQTDGPGLLTGPPDLESDPHPWARETVPDPNVNLVKIWGTSATDVYAIGYDPIQKGSVVLHSNGSGAFTTQLVPANADLNAIWGSSATDVYVAGSTGEAYGPLVLHSTGNGTWTEEDSGLDTRIAALWGSGPGDVYAVGDAGAHSMSHKQAGFWQPAAAPTAYLLSVWGASADDVYMGGFETIYHSTDGAAFAAETPPSGSFFLSIHGAGDAVFALGADSKLLRRAGASAWQPLTLPPVVGQFGYLAVFATSADDLYAVGESGRIVHSIDGGQSFTIEHSGTGVTFMSVWAAGHDVYAAGQAGTILHAVK